MLANNLLLPGIEINYSVLQKNLDGREEEGIYHCCFFIKNKFLLFLLRNYAVISTCMI